MPRPHIARFAAIFLSAALSTACAVNPPPRPVSSGNYNGPQAPVAASPVRFGTIPPSAPPAIAAESAIVVDADSGRVLYAKNADVRRQVASTQKIITALCVIDGGNIDSPVTIDKSDTACEPTRLDLKAGDTYTRRNLLKSLMVKSCNDVARALARDVGGSQEGFSDLMNQKAASLGMRNSHFLNPNGLPNAAQYSTARDMAIAARYAYRSPLLRSFVATKAYDFQFADGHTKLLENTNRVLKSVPYCNGMKTGTTDAAGRCLVCTGSLNGRSTIVVVLKSNTPNIWKDSEKLLRWSLEH
ncbi:D-alanyl-D-alanine carboxypeptidase family protein [Luteolibacter sp. LG18]|uniref:D-alanyl-D-alanine carboxypeptidase family protein n=1 Tax=Luteolibacter sp. LG18 TaxID=2819286 RepID=UPI0030C7555A